ncbi:MAG: MscS family membrane protein [Gammaproteobacteria bacterium]|jgi:MscS family membrane protein
MSKLLFRCIRLFATVLPIVFSCYTFAQISAPQSAPAESSAPPPPIPASLQSPRATMGTFLDAMKRAHAGDDDQLGVAVTALDLEEINPLVRAEKGRDLAWILLEVIQRTRLPKVERFSTRTSGKPFVFHSYDNGAIEISFKENQGWRFSSSTVAALPRLLDDLSGAENLARVEDQGATSTLPLHLRLRAMIPADWKEHRFILENWQWAAILLVILIGIILDKLVTLLLSVAVGHWKKRYAIGAFRNISDSILRPFGLMAMAFAWWAGINMLGLPGEALVILLVSVKFVACLSTVWGAYRLVDLIAAVLFDVAARTSSRVDDALVPLVTKTMKVFVTVMGIIFIADNLDIDVTSLLAGLGLGGLAFALAAKDVAGNVFGSVTVLLDQTFHVGDWIIVGDVEGSVEHIGFRSTRVRTFYNSVVSVPNSIFITATVDNMGERTYRRLSCKLSITYDTPPERIEAFCEAIRELVRQHPYTRKDYFHVYLNEFSASAIEILLYVFWETPEWSTELRERHRFLLDCLRVAKQLGVEYAYPTQTLYMKQADSESLAPAKGLYTSIDGELDVFAAGRAQAQAIVAATTGTGVVPPPVDPTEHLNSE